MEPRKPEPQRRNEGPEAPQVEGGEKDQALPQPAPAEPGGMIGEGGGDQQADRDGGMIGEG